MPDEEIARVMESQREEGFEVDPENWDAIVLFMRSQTQWIISGMGQRTGLYYAGVEAVARISGVSLTAELFDQVQLLELTTINELNKRTASNGQTLSRSRHRR